MKRMRHSVRAFMAAALFAVVAAVLFVLSAFGFLVQWRDGTPVTVQGTVKAASLQRPSLLELLTYQKRQGS
jgi:succinate dehydrogenase hydrophobic anchor subunit